MSGHSRVERVHVHSYTGYMYEYVVCVSSSMMYVCTYTYVGSIVPS